MSYELIGWAATAVFVGSSACREPARLRQVQAVAACMWMAYGAVIGAAPVVVANLLVAGVAAWSSLRPLAARRLPPASGA